jgi:putative membrane protein
MSGPAGQPMDLSYERTRMAADRTLMAWIRTSLSMISFGFTIYKFFQYLYESNALAPGIHIYGPRNLGEVLVILGTVLMGFAIVEYVLYQRLLSRQAGRKFPVSTTLIGALLMIVLGFFALANLLFRLGPL